MLKILCLFLLASPALSYYYYQTRLPNGEHVPHPCKANYIWHGVGHKSPTGGGARNPFGEDFAANGHKWTRELCGLDSDGDGLTNGQELGDPECVWTEGRLPARVDNITHPGVCDPWGSGKCNSQNSWVSCEDTSFKCDALNDPEVRNMSIRFTKTKVPAEDTTYMCQVFEVPDDQEYHIIATTPIIDNHNVMHHMGLMECFEHAQLTDAPVPCGMTLPGCGNLIGLWTLGMSGQCLHENAGFRIGKGGIRKVALQFHWTNKNHIEGWEDASGMTLYFTPKLRPYNAGMAIFGQEYLEIPPKRSKVTETGGCSAQCTSRYMDSPVYITSALNHMHYLGNEGRTELYRDGHKVRDIAIDKPYAYDNPHLHIFKDPVPFGPGDEIRVTCHYSSLSKPVTTMWGEGSYDEMCYIIMSYYPKEKLVNFCNKWKNIDKCSMRDDGCNFFNFFNTSDPQIKGMMDKVLSHCTPYGKCRDECRATLQELRSSQKCMQGEYWDFMKNRLITRPFKDTLLYKFAAAVDSCTNVTKVEPTTTPQPKCDNQQPSDKQDGYGMVNAFAQLAKELGSRPLLQNIIFNSNNNRNSN